MGEHDHGLRRMLTRFGLGKGFELRRVSRPYGSKRRMRWVVVLPSGFVRDATDYEVRLWTALPNTMREELSP